jgi:hypothetical protein
VAKDIGNDNNLSAEEHPSIKIIKENKKEIPKLIFHEIENDFDIFSYITTLIS